jgi:dihydropteroate synthase
VSAPLRILRARGLTLPLQGDPVLMGIVNATRDSFSDAGDYDPITRVRELGARWIDVGGESAAGAAEAVAAQEEIARVVPVVRAAAATGAVVSVDTYKPEVAEAAIEAGAHVVNDVSGLRDSALAEVCARTGAGLVVMHTRAAPKQTLLDPGFYDDVVADVLAFLRERMQLAREAGVGEEQLLVDPGPDFTKTPAQTVAVLRRLGDLHALGRPVLAAISRKDVLGAITGRPARERGAATLAALGAAADAGAHIARVHDVAAAADFLAARAVLRGDAVLEPHAGLTPERYPDGTVVPGTYRP